MQLAGDGERERAAASLREHFVRGRLTLEELSERTEVALRARSREELRRSLDGLPGEKGAQHGQAFVHASASGARIDSAELDLPTVVASDTDAKNQATAGILP